MYGKQHKTGEINLSNVRGMDEDVLRKCYIKTNGTLVKTDGTMVK